MTRSGLRALVTITLMNSSVEVSATVPSGWFAVPACCEREGRTSCRPKRSRIAAIWKGLVTSSDSICTCARCRSVSSWRAVLPVSRTVAVTCQPPSTRPLRQCQAEPTRAAEEKNSSRSAARLNFGWIFSYYHSNRYKRLYMYFCQDPRWTARTPVRQRHPPSHLLVPGSRLIALQLPHHLPRAGRGVSRSVGEQ